MKLTTLRICNFQSFGPKPIDIDLSMLTYLVGPNGAGKTAILQALCRMFGDLAIRRIHRSDFHVAARAGAADETAPPTFWIEADFHLEELKDETPHPTVPASFRHMRLAAAVGLPRVRMRLTATLHPDGDVEEKLLFVLETDKDGSPAKTEEVSRHDRGAIQVHYLPAKRDPGDHISYATNSLLGRLLRSATWDSEREVIMGLTQEIGKQLAGNKAVAGIGEALSGLWSALHRGTFYAAPQIVFGQGELEGLLRQLSVGFSPGHESPQVDYSRLSDGQKSLLYLSMVLTAQRLGRAALAGEFEHIDLEKLRPAVFTLIAMEEPENSLSPHYLGRVVAALADFSQHHDGQALVATHAPSMLRRVPPEQVRYVRLDAQRQSLVRAIVLPEAGDADAHKYVREAVQAFPELYFSRLVLLGEGDSEEIVLPRFMRAFGLSPDDQATSIAPLGGRHVHHFWRLLDDLAIPYVTLLDLDLARHQGGWGRVRYATTQLLKNPSDTKKAREVLKEIPDWKTTFVGHAKSQEWIDALESQQVFYSSLLDLDFAMLMAYPDAYGLEPEAPDEARIVAVLGKSHGDDTQYVEVERRAFASYHHLFKVGSKPASHMSALAKLDDETLKAGAPAYVVRLMQRIAEKLKDCPE